MPILRLMFSRKWILATILVFLGSALCARLGIWQLDRLEQRRAFNAHYLATSALPALQITSEPADDLTTMEYRPVTVTGRYDFEHQVALRNRYHDNQPGYHLLSPLVLSDGTAILIERGWIPSAGNAAPADWRQYDQPGEVTLSGIIRQGQTKPDVGGVPDPEAQTHLDFWNLLNVARIAAQVPYKLLPVYIQPNPQPDNSQPPIPFQPAIEISEGPHFGYAGQWFIFATLLFFGYPLLYLRKIGLQSLQTLDTPKSGDFGVQKEEEK